MAQRARPRLVDVAQAAGVSIAAASRALSGAAGVSEEIAQRVREVAAELGYVANVHARTLAGGTSTGVGLLVHEIGDPYFTEIASGVLRVAAQRGLTVQIGHTGRDPDAELLQVRSLIANRVRAIVISGSGFVEARVQAPVKRELQDFQAAGGRVAVIGRHHLGTDAVLPDNLAGGRSITEHVLSLGHRRIAFAAGPVALTTVADRLAGAEEALRAAGSRLAELPVIEEAFTRDGGTRATLRILDEHPRTTAVIALNDDMAIGALAALRSRGVAVPREMSVAGFDDVAVAEHLSPALTTVRLPMTGMGEQALLLALKEPSVRPRRRTTGHRLVVRDSTAAPRSS
ncbi:transcriptional regulator, LacI family [Saccharopolyspora kobensis]|uniref:Transcriptional regulator, LacI family n=1 Tax=Saccharopolyspora kobensis TaxID=146035 RepID=A0A1H5WLC6_9PSEU|nr:LacI family DNA-binding transcriptional regulator [Saccharopolyspora kobensis]SEG00080.1 transcriptional regulator, LacI family [Saccharopolyspora kobensis]SFD76742.1 transcriptional regulator, LacI family [Saccharopolyspora kobensis]